MSVFDLHNLRYASSGNARVTAAVRATLLLGGGLLLAASQARAADDLADGADAGDALESVVVSTRNATVKQLEAEKDVPKSVSVVTGAELEKLDALNVTDVLKRIGNVQWNYGNPKTGSLSIRGVSAGSSEQIDPSLGVVVDGVPYAYVALASAADYVDIASVDVTRGPQGSTGGKNTSMGTITITSNLPSFTPESHGSVTLGQGNAVIAQAALGGPVIDDLVAWRGTFYRNQQQGPYNNSYADNTGRNSWGNSDRTFGRVQFLLKPTDAFSGLVSFNIKPKGIEFVNGMSVKLQQPYVYADGAPAYIANGLPNATNTIQNKLNRSYFTAESSFSYQDYLNQLVAEDDDKGIQNGSDGGFVKLDWEVLNHRIESVSAYEYNFFQASNDEGTPFNVTTDSGLYVHYRQVSEELSLSSQPGGFIDYKTGLFFIKTRSDANSRTRYGSDSGAYYVTDPQYTTLNANASGVELLTNSLNRTYATNTTYTDNTSAAAFGQINWHLSDPLTLTTGLRFTNEDRKTSVSKLVQDDGFGAALDPALNGGFASTTTGALGSGNSVAQLSLADALAHQYFGTTITGTPGAAYGSLNAAQLKQVAAAKAVRASQAFNGLYPITAAQPYRGTLTTGNVSLTYKLNEALTSYLSWQHGAKAGIAQISGVDKNLIPISRLVAPESSNDYELGVKGNFLQGALIVNADIFLDRLKNYQQSVTIFDPVLTAQNAGVSTYTAITGNAPLVEIKGLELDAAYIAIPHVVLRFAGAYNHAVYKDSVLLAQPVENGDLAQKFYDAKGQTLPNAPKLTGNLSADFELPVFTNKVLHSNVNYHYSSAFNSDASNSAYAEVKGYGLVDLGVGFGRRDGRFDVNLLVKNAFNTSYRYSSTWTSYVPGLPRWFGVAFSGSIY